MTTPDTSTLDFTVRSNNLYRNSALYVFADGSGEMLLLRELTAIPPNINDEYHTVGTDDFLDAIAYKYYSPYVQDASKFWWIIADANDIQEPIRLDDFVNKQIRIPYILNVLLLLE